MASTSACAVGSLVEANLIRGFGDNDAVFYDDRTEWPTAPGADVFNRELNCAGHERVVHAFAVSTDDPRQ